MKICLITTSFPRNQSDDAGIFIAKLVSALSKLNLEGIIIAPHENGSSLEETFCGWQVNRIKYGLFFKGSLAYGSGILPNIKQKPWRIFQIPSLLIMIAIHTLQKSKSFDLIHANWIASALPALLIRKIIKKPLLVSIRGEDIKLLNLPLFGISLRLLLKSAEISTVSSHFKEKLEKLFPLKKIHLVENGVDPITMNPELVSDLLNKYQIIRGQYGIYAGRVIQLKRIELLIEIISKIDDKNFKLVICGALDSTEYVFAIREKLKSLNLENRVLLLGNVNPLYYRQLLSAAKLYFSASQFEGRPNSVLEALAQGIPCVLSDIDAHQNLVEDSKNGYLFSDKNLDICINKLNKILSDSDLHHNLSQNAITSLKNSSWESSAKKYFVIYENLLNNNFI